MNKKGLTLVETLVYISIVSVFLVSIITFIDHVISVRTKSRSIEEVQQNARFALERIAQEVRSANSINADSTLGADLEDNVSYYLHLDHTDIAEDVYFQVNANNQLTIKTGASGIEETITNNLLEIENLTFTDITNSSTQQAVKVDFSIKFTNSNNLQEYDWSMDLNDTLTVRKP